MTLPYTGGTGHVPTVFSSEEPSYVFVFPTGPQLGSEQLPAPVSGSLETAHVTGRGWPSCGLAMGA